MIKNKINGTALAAASVVTPAEAAVPLPIVTVARQSLQMSVKVVLPPLQAFIFSISL